MNTYLHKATQVTIIVLAALLFQGCTINVIPRPEHLSFSSESAKGQMVQEKTVLLLRPAFKQYVMHWTHGQQPFDFVFGQAFTDYAKNVATGSFQFLKVVEGDIVPADSQAVFVLEPKVKNIAVTSPIFAWSDQQMTIDIEWTLRRGTQDQVIWAATVEGNGSDGFAEPALIEATMKDLWAQTMKSFAGLRSLDLSSVR